MRTTFIHPDFLLETQSARKLYHRFAESLPIIDFHNHLPPADIARDRKFASLTEIWLEGDHYKWRAMRACGVDERFVTGDATPWEKFERWAETVPRTLRNPLYHWTHLELARPFGITDRLLGPATARAIWEKCNAKLATPAFSARGILMQMKVEALCTTDDPVDSLEHHVALQSDPTMKIRVYPAFRPDLAMAIDDLEGFQAYLGRLSDASGQEISTFETFLEALAQRHAYFHEHGCRLSDHGLEQLYNDPFTRADAERSFKRLLKRKRVEGSEARALKSAILHELAIMDAERGWVQQLHLGALRNVSRRMMRRLGANTGYDTIGDFPMASAIAGFLDRLDEQGKLAKTILYNLNPGDNELFAAMIGNFQDGTVPGKVQYGAAWWFLDQLDGMTKQINALSSLGLLSQFVGMLTDSRSFLSFPRHEYFRRLLCNILGNDMERGLIPHDLDLVGGMVCDICYNNVRRYLDLPYADPPHASATTSHTKERR